MINGQQEEIKKAISQATPSFYLIPPWSKTRGEREKNVQVNGTRNQMENVLERVDKRLIPLRHSFPSLLYSFCDQRRECKQNRRTLLQKVSAGSQMDNARDNRQRRDTQTYFPSQSFSFFFLLSFHRPRNE